MNDYELRRSIIQSKRLQRDGLIIAIKDHSNSMDVRLYCSQLLLEWSGMSSYSSKLQAKKCFDLVMSNRFGAIYSLEDISC